MIDVDGAIQEFLAREPLYEQACEVTVPLLKQLLQGSSIRLHSIVPRVKTASSLKEKLGREGKTYLTLSDVKDVVGIRIITYFEDDLAELGKIISSEFAVDSAHSYDLKTRLETDQFGYRSIHYVCQYNPDRLRLREYSRFADIDMEIQTRSILQHAWAEIEHEYYKSRGPKPPEIQRRNSILAGVLELADAEFISIRKAMEVYRMNIELRLETQGDVDDVRLDSISLETVISQDSDVAELDRELVQSQNVEVRNTVGADSVAITLRALGSIGVVTVGQLRSLVREKAEQLPPFINLFRNWNREHAGGVSESYPRGISLYHLALLVASQRGSAELKSLFEATYEGKPKPPVLAATIEALPKFFV